MVYLGGFILATTAAVVSYRLKLLTRGGAFVAFLMGWIVFSLGQLPFSAPILFFFVSSNLLSKTNHTQKSRLYIFANDMDRRNWFQVFANGFVPTILVIAWSFKHDMRVVFLFLIALASATSDTWASEIGILSQKKPRSIISFKPADAGSSGGVTLLGFWGAAIGSFSLAITGGWIFYRLAHINFTWYHIFSIFAIGVFSQTVDSILGASLQAKYLCPVCQKTIEKPTHLEHGPARCVAGFSWVDNSVVNLFSIIIGTLVGWLSLGTMQQ